MKKRVLCIVMVLVMAVTLFPSVSVSVKASGGVRAALDGYCGPWVGRQFPYSYFRGSTEAAGGCHAFVNAVWKNIFGYDTYDGVNRTTSHQTSYDNLGNFIQQNGRVGDILRFSNTHSFIIQSISDSGITAYESRGGRNDNEVLRTTISYSQLRSRYNGVPYFLYQINDDIYYSTDGYVQTWSAPPTGPFQDVSLGDWYFEAVSFSYGRGLMIGSDGLFFPDETITREQAVVIIARLSGGEHLNYAGQSPFDDVDADRWSAAEIAWAKAKGITNGIDGQRFDPTSIVTLQQFEVMLMRHFRLDEWWSGRSTECARANAAYMLHYYVSRYGT